MKIGEFTEKKKESNAKYYLGAVVAGLVLFALILGATKFLILAGGFLFVNWMYAAGIIFAMFVIKKIFFRKRIAMPQQSLEQH